MGSDLSVSQQQRTGMHTGSGMKPSSHPFTRPVKPRGIWRDLFLTINCILTVPMYSMMLCMALFLAVFAMVPVTWLRSLMLLYIPWCLMDTTPASGGWKQWRSIARNWPGFRWLAEYFDMELIKEEALDPSQKYIFLYHPHGVIGIGCNAALNTNGCHFEKVFPGVQRSGVTLNATFFTPLFREWILMNGFVSANRDTLLDTLTKESIILVPGGAAEALHSHPGVLKIHIQNRKGFIRLALDAKVPILPCIGFGENEIFDTVYVNHGEAFWEQCLWFLQQRLMKLLSFSMPIWTSVIPNKTKITVLVGSPIQFDENKSVDECHAMYLQHLSELYEKNKSKYGYDKVSLEFV